MGNNLTVRDREVHGLLVEGASNKLTAQRPGISVNTA
jgi:DNA-binding CsgD family transcriptional regulator